MFVGRDILFTSISSIRILRMRFPYITCSIVRGARYVETRNVGSRGKGCEDPAEGRSGA